MRHRFHAICPYFAMFPEEFVQEHLSLVEPGEVVFDPFSGRGTTVLQSLLDGRQAAACDTNPVAVCVSRAKADPPCRRTALDRLRDLQSGFTMFDGGSPGQEDDFFRACFHPTTLQQILYLRSTLDWKKRKSDCFLAAICLGRLHGESHKSSSYFSNRMPRSICLKPGYSVRWWRDRGLVAPERDVFEILRRQVDFRFASSPAELRGQVAQADARDAAKVFSDLRGKVSLVITSPPYLDTTNFREDQWLRNWFLGERALSSARLQDGDHRHWCAESYWRFLAEAWAGVAPLLRSDAHLVIRIGGRKLSACDRRDGLTTSLARAMPERRLTLVDYTSSEIPGTYSRMVRRETRPRDWEHDFHFRVG